jgi:hypothetical protein
MIEQLQYQIKELEMRLMDIEKRMGIERGEMPAEKY